MVKLTKEQIEYRKKMNKLIKQGKIKNRHGETETKLFEIPRENKKNGCGTGCVITLFIIYASIAITILLFSKTAQIGTKKTQETKEKPNIEQNNTQEQKKYEIQITGMNNNQIIIDKGYEKFTGTLKFTQLQEIQYTDSCNLEYQLEGYMEKGNMVYIKILCYDSEDFIIETTSIMESGEEGKELKYKNNIIIPRETRKIEVIQNE